MDSASHIRIERVCTYAGPSVFAREPVVVARLTIDSEALADARTRIERMSTAFSPWFEWQQSESAPGALEIGKFLVRWTRCALTEVRVFLHVSDALAVRDGVLLILGYHDPGISFSALELAAKLFTQIELRSPKEIAASVSELWRACQRRHPDYQAVILMSAARSAGIPVLPFLRSSRCWQ